jgi:hypothetical protein
MYIPLVQSVSQDPKAADLSFSLLSINPRSGKYVSDPLREGTTHALPL